MTLGNPNCYNESVQHVRSRCSIQEKILQWTVHISCSAATRTLEIASLSETTSSYENTISHHGLHQCLVSDEMKDEAGKFLPFNVLRPAACILQHGLSALLVNKQCSSSEEPRPRRPHTWSYNQDQSRRPLSSQL